MFKRVLIKIIYRADFCHCWYLQLVLTLVKSPIDRSERQKLTLQALGLNKTNASKEVEATPQILGMVRKVTHLVKVEELAN